MIILIIGLCIFLGLHSFRIVSDAGRSAAIHRLGEARFKGTYSVLSLIGLVLLVYGYGQARMGQSQLYEPVAGLRHLALILVPLSFILVASSYAPVGRIKAWVRHPMVLGVALWALGHLLANGGMADVVLYGAFFMWAAVDYVNSLGRPVPVLATAPRLTGDLVAIAIGLVLSIAFIAGLHLWFFGVSPIG